MRSDAIIRDLLRAIYILIFVLVLLYFLFIMGMVELEKLPANIKPLKDLIGWCGVSEEFLPAIITILTLVISVAYPLAVQLVSKPEGSRFAADVTLLLFDEPTYKRMRGLIALLVMLLVLYFFLDGTGFITSAVALGMGIYSLNLLRQFLSLLTRYVSEFHVVLKEKAQRELDEVL